MRNKELAKNTAVIFIGTICTKMVTFLLLPLYTGILSTGEYGIVDLLNTLILLLIPIITFQVEQAVFRELLECRNNEEKKKTVISSAIFSVIFQCLVYAIIFAVVSAFIDNKYKYFLALNVFSSIFSSLFLQISRGLGDNVKYSLASFISATSTIIFNILFLVVMNLRVTGMLLGTLIGQVLCILYLFFSLKIYKYISIKKYSNSQVKQLWKYSLPLVPNQLSWWIFDSSDRVIVSSFLGLSFNGILSASSKFAAAYTVLYNVFDRSWIESVSLHINDKDIESYFNKTLNVILKMFAGLALVGIAFLPYLYPLMINKKFHYGYYLVPVLIISAFFNVIQGLIAVVYAAKKDTKSVAKTSIAAASINIFIHLALIKKLGIFAAVFSTLGAYFIIALYRYFDVKKKYLNIKFEKELIITCIIGFSIEIVLYYLNTLMFNLISIILSICLFIYLNKNSFGVIINMVKKRR